jgi:zinc protease
MSDVLHNIRRDGVTSEELDRAKAQLRARLIFDNDSITNIAHQLGYFETVGSVDLFTGLRPRIEAVTVEEVADVVRSLLTDSNRTVAWFDPVPIA